MDRPKAIVTRTEMSSKLAQFSNDMKQEVKETVKAAAKDGAKEAVMDAKLDFLRMADEIEKREKRSLNIDDFKDKHTPMTTAEYEKKQRKELLWKVGLIFAAIALGTDDALSLIGMLF